MTNEDMRSVILDAVYEVVGRNGLTNTTIDAIAAQAGISKGGVLYYFSSKKDLLTGMMDRYEILLREHRDEIAAKLPDSPYRILKATIMAMLEELEKTRSGIPNFAALLDDEELRKHVGALKKRLFKEVVAGCPNPERVVFVLFAMDGIWMDVRFKPSFIPKEQWDAGVKEMLRYIDSMDN